MVGLADQAVLAANTTFIGRVEQAIITRIRSQIGGVVDSGTLALFRRILDDPAPVAIRIAKAIVPDAAIAARAPTETTVTDAEINAAVAVVLPYFVR